MYARPLYRLSILLHRPQQTTSSESHTERKAIPLLWSFLNAYQDLPGNKSIYLPDHDSDTPKVFRSLSFAKDVSTPSFVGTHSAPHFGFLTCLVHVFGLTRHSPPLSDGQVLFRLISNRYVHRSLLYQRGRLTCTYNWFCKETATTIISVLINVSVMQPFPLKI